MWATARGVVMIRHVRDKWLRRPHGEPSGVCTGHRNPVMKSSQYSYHGLLSDRLTPGFGKQFTNSGSLQLREESTTMYGSEMADVPHPVQLFGHNSET